MCAVLLAAAAAWYLVPRARMRAQIKKFAEADSCFTLDLDSDALTLSVPAFLSGDYLGATLDGQAVYICGERITLANGQALTFGMQLIDLRQVLSQTAELTWFSQTQDGAYTVRVDGENAQKLLASLPEGLLPTDGAVVTLTAMPGDTMPESLTMLLSTTSTRFELTLTPMDGTPTVPESVLNSDGEPMQLTFDEDLVPLLRATLKFAGQSRYAATATLDVGASVLNVQQVFSIIYDRSIGIGVLQSDAITLYFSPTAVCTESGQSITTFDEVQPREIFLLAMPLLTDGRVESLRDGEDGRYSCALTDEETEGLTALVREVSPLLTGVTLTSSSAEAQVKDNTLSELSFACSGEIEVLVTVPVTLTLTLEPVDAPETVTVPQAVLDTLGQSAA